MTGSDAASPTPSVRRLEVLLATALLLGVLFLAVGGAVHPVLTGDAASDLRTIAGTPAWRGIHLALLAGSGLLAVGVWVRPLAGGPVRGLTASLVAISLGVAIDALNIAYMTGSGTQLAAHFAAGDSAAVAIYDATHPAGLVAARFGNFLVAVGALALGFAEHADRTRPKWIAWLACTAGIGGLAGVLLFHETSRMVLAPIGLLTLWSVAAGIAALRRRTPRG